MNNDVNKQDYIEMLDVLYANQIKRTSFSQILKGILKKDLLEEGFVVNHNQFWYKVANGLIFCFGIGAWRGFPFINIDIVPLWVPFSFMYPLGGPGAVFAEKRGTCLTRELSREYSKATDEFLLTRGLDGYEHVERQYCDKVRSIWQKVIKPYFARFGDMRSFQVLIDREMEEMWRQFMANHAEDMKDINKNTVFANDYRRWMTWGEDLWMNNQLYYRERCNEGALIECAIRGTYDEMLHTIERRSRTDGWFVMPDEAHIAALIRKDKAYFLSMAEQVIQRNLTLIGDKCSKKRIQMLPTVKETMTYLV